ncbi:hypothetical protein L1887_62011 [Cichorium endivia]|nr:hypothetical protein L1887_62011 [Cichorium endivia]
MDILTSTVSQCSNVGRHKQHLTLAPDSAPRCKEQRCADPNTCRRLDPTHATEFVRSETSSSHSTLSWPYLSLRRHKGSSGMICNIEWPPLQNMAASTSEPRCPPRLCTLLPPPSTRRLLNKKIKLDC